MILAPLEMSVPARDGLIHKGTLTYPETYPGVGFPLFAGLASNLNAELRVGNTTTGVSNKIQDLTLVSAGPSYYSARLGAGGPQIEVSNVTGTIVLQRI